MTINVIAQRLAEEPSAWLYNRERWGAREARLGSSRESEGCGREPGGLSGPGRVARRERAGGGRERGADRATRTRSAETGESWSMIGPAGG